MLNRMPALADRVAQMSVDAYNNKLSKTGKLMSNEWTILSCIVQYNHLLENMQVVSLGTGSKCIGAAHMSPKGDILQDSHAEVIARRGFLLYLYDSIKKSAAGENTIFRLDNGKFKLDENIEFYLYTSQLPCGDACIMPKATEEDLKLNVGEMLPTNKRQADGNDFNDENSKKQKIESGDYHRTGAKCLPHGEQDKLKPGAGYHTLGQVRTKPGRGDPTLSVSCTDKFARWIHVGIQGALLDMLIQEPIFLKLYVVGAEVPYSQEAIDRAFFERNPEWTEANLKWKPQVQQSKVIFPHKKDEVRTKISHHSVLWVNLHPNPCLEVAIKGIKQGFTKKNKTQNLKYSLSISKYQLYTKFLTILLALDKEVIEKFIGKETNLQSIPYNEMKRKSTRYLQKWAEVKNNFFGKWTVKPDIWNFCVDFTNK